MDEISIKVEGGRLVATKTGDISYPGIDVEFIPDNQKETLSRPRVLFEKPKGEALRVLIWEDEDNEDFTKQIKFNK